MIAAREDQADCLQLLIQAGARFDIYNSNKQNPLHLACEESNVECVEILLQQGFDINAVDIFHRSPLYLCCGNFRARTIECIRLLLQRNLLVNIADHYDRTPLHICASLGADEIIPLLLDSGANPKLIDKSGKLPSDLAAHRESTSKLLHDAEGKIYKLFK